MNYEINEISGNSYCIRMYPETPKEVSLLNANNDEEAISCFYSHAVKSKLDGHLKVASLTPNADFPLSATVEVFTESGSV